MSVDDVERDVASLRALVAESERPTDDSELQELLGRLDSANTMATGVEARLDDILGTLDDLLTSLEPKDKPQETVTSPSGRS